MRPVFIIAEAGVNHNGDIQTAEKMVDVAVAAGADAVKFQAFQASALACRNAPMAAYQIRNIKKKDTQFKMLQSLELDYSSHQHLKAYCKEKNITFMSSAFDMKSLDSLIKLKVQPFKIPSGEITNVPYLERIGAQKSEVILSTGMASMDEVGFAVKILNNFGTQVENIALLHCCSEYPAPFSNVNLNAMASLSKEFPKARIGYSDHTQGIEIAIAAVAMGATIIEKHFTLDRKMKGPDHIASIEPDELKGMVCAIRNTQKALGKEIKTLGTAEFGNRELVRKSIVANRDIRRGEIFTVENLTVKRPGTGLSATKWNDVLGKEAKKNFGADEQISL